MVLEPPELRVGVKQEAKVLTERYAKPDIKGQVLAGLELSCGIDSPSLTGCRPFSFQC